MCIACVMRVGDQEHGGQVPGGDGERPGVLAGWSPADTARAAAVYRQLPGWSRQLFDMLAAEPDRMFPISLLRALLVEPGGQFSVEEICDWAAPFCTAVGRHLPVLIQLSASGEPVCQMEQTAARLFQSVARPAARPVPRPEVLARPGAGSDTRAGPA
jgi:hypothetical protein